MCPIYPIKNLKKIYKRQYVWVVNMEGEKNIFLDKSNLVSKILNLYFIKGN